MKTNKLLIAALLSMALNANAAKENANPVLEEVEISMDQDGDQMTKTITVNGKNLNAKEIVEFEASGVGVLHMDAPGSQSKEIKVMVINAGDGNPDEKIEILVDSDGVKTTEKIIVNGKELSPEEILEFKASGKMKIMHFDSDMPGIKGHKMMFVNSDSAGGDVDIEVIMDKLEALKGENGLSILSNWVSEDGKSIKIIRKGMHLMDANSASLGIMASVEDDGWHLSKVLDESGAKEAGIMQGDVVIKIADKDLTAFDDADSKQIPNFEDGEMVEVELLRDGQVMVFDVEARILDNHAMMAGMHSDGGKHFQWIKELSDGQDLSSQVKVMVFDSLDGQFNFNEDDINMVFPESISKMNLFISDGKSTSKLLGKNHEMSAMTDGLSKYFGTNGGVLVMHVDETNAFGLQDGDVIKLVNGELVNSPKEVIKELIQAQEQDKIVMKVVRHKKTKSLKYKK